MTSIADHCADIGTLAHKQFLFQGGMTDARTALGAASCNGLLYAVSGECADTVDDTAYLPTIEAYNAQLKTWQPRMDMKQARSFAAVVSTTKYIYVLGGLLYKNRDSCE